MSLCRWSCAVCLLSVYVHRPSTVACVVGSVGTKLVHYNNNVLLSNAFHFCTESLQFCLMDPYNMIFFVWPHYHVLAISFVDFLPDVNHIIFQRSYSIDNNLYKSVVFQHGRDTKEWIPELIFGILFGTCSFQYKIFSITLPMTESIATCLQNCSIPNSYMYWAWALNSNHCC